jgi:WD40 repeat protein
MLPRFATQRASLAIVCLSAAIALAASCDWIANSAAAISYEQEIRPLLRKHCVGCHNAARPRGDLDLSSYESIHAGGASGSVVTPGDPEDSLLYLLAAGLEEPVMPPGPDRIDDASLEALRNWIANGALEADSPQASPMSASADKGAEQQPDSQQPPSLVPADAVPMMREELREELREEMRDETQLAEQPGTSPPVPLQTEASADEGLLLAPVFRGSAGNAVTALDASAARGLVAAAGQRQVVLYDGDSGELAGVLPFPEGELFVLRFSLDGRLLLGAGGTAGELGRAVVWDLETGRRRGTYANEPDVLLAADLSPDGSALVLGGPGREVIVVDTATGSERARIEKHPDWVLAASFSPDGFLFATGDRVGNTYVWEADSLELMHTLPGASQPVTGIVWSADGDHCVTASEDGVVRIWEMHGGKQVRQWSAHEGGVLSIATGPAEELVTSGRDRQLRSWDWQGRALEASLHVDELPLQVSVLETNHWILGQWDGLLAHWRPEWEVPQPLAPPEQWTTSNLADLPQLEPHSEGLVAGAGHANSTGHSPEDSPEDSFRDPSAATERVTAQGAGERAEEPASLQTVAAIEEAHGELAQQLAAACATTHRAAAEISAQLAQLRTQESILKESLRQTEQLHQQLARRLQTLEAALQELSSPIVAAPAATAPPQAASSQRTSRPDSNP